MERNLEDLEQFKEYLKEKGAGEQFVNSAVAVNKTMEILQDYYRDMYAFVNQGIRPSFENFVNSSLDVY